MCSLGFQRFKAVLLSVLVAGLLAKATATPSKLDVSLGSREEQIAFWEKEVQKLSTGSLLEAERQLRSAQYALEQANKQKSWFFASEHEKARIQQLDEEYRRRLNEVALLQKQEDMLLAKLKPLYGIVSQRFVQEQRETILSTLHKLKDMSYDQAWYSSMFNIREAESITDLLIGFFVEWFMSYVIMYPFASIYYALWTAPWSIYAYSSGPSDIVVGVLAWVVSVTFMSLPLLALGGGCWYIKRKYGIQFAQLFARPNMPRHRRPY
uniref:Uncharacterized protein n=1 Tax=Trypanosoma congolense (strain IL3000) TaxID=1068625 RepID=G0UKJ8_TRYCI|nr:conserved hypothetical protein [Trypanosoma congolense IL3000]